LHTYFQTFLPAIKQLPPYQSLTKEDLLTDSFLIGKDGALSMYYAPHNEYINKKAIIVIVGITPGWNQMKTAFEQVLKGLNHNQTVDQMLKEAKKAASFSGTMRQNLIRMLDECGVHEEMQVDSSSALFEKHRELIHTTSIIKYPVFYQGKNYSGHKPRIQKSSLLANYAFDVFLEELRHIQQPALIIPLGKTVEHVFKELLNEEKLPNHFYLFGFPHPSGANGHRKRHLQERKESLISTVRAWAQNKV